MRIDADRVEVSKGHRKHKILVRFAIQVVIRSGYKSSFVIICCAF